MNHYNHLVFGTTLCIIFAYIFNQYFGWYSHTNIILFSVIVILSSLIMDLDHRSGKINRVILGSGLLISTTGIIFWHLFKGNWMYVAYSGTLLASLIFFLPVFFKHRGFLHSIAFALIFSIIVFLIAGKELGILAFIGCYSHLIGDKLCFKLI